MGNELVTYELRDSVALIGLNRPDKRNAINMPLIAALSSAVQQAQEEARCAVIHGGAGAHFSAGLDLAEAGQNASVSDRRRKRKAWHSAFDLISRGDIPFISALKGACIGGGLELAAATHIRVADETTFFGLPEGQRGIFVGGGGSVRIQRLMGYARMADLMLTGRILSAAEGERANLCQYVTPAGTSLEQAIALAGKITRNSALSNWGIAACLPRVNDLSYDDGLFFEGLISNSVRGDETATRIRDFVEKRADKVAPPSSDG